MYLRSTNHFIVKLRKTGNAPVSVCGDIYITDFDGRVFRLDKNGKVNWVAQPSTKNTWSGILSNGKFIYAEIAGQSRYARALDCESGEVMWHHDNGGHSYALSTDSHGRLVYASASGASYRNGVSLNCVDCETGKSIWRTEHPKYLFRSLLDEKYIYIGSRGGIALFDINSGRYLGEYTFEEKDAANTTPIQTSNGMVFATENGRVICVKLTEFIIEEKNISVLEEVWSCNLDVKIKSDPVIVGNEVLVISEDGQLNYIDSTLGRVVNKYKISSFVEGYGIAVHDQDKVVIAATKEIVLYSVI